jgi:TatA/E family protein of Tat protein translocase
MFHKGLAPKYGTLRLLSIAWRGWPYNTMIFKGHGKCVLVRKRRKTANAYMGSLGMQEIIIIFIVALIIFGPRKLPELGKTLGKGLAEFKRASNELKQTWEDEVRLDKEKEEVTKILNESAAQTTEAVQEIKDDINNTLNSASVENKETK